MALQLSQAFTALDLEANLRAFLRLEVDGWKETAVAEQSQLLPVTRYRARVRFLQLRPAEIVL
jgi:hypothetical protein